MSSISNELLSSNYSNYNTSPDSEEDVQSWYSLGGQRVIQKINVKSILETQQSMKKTKKNTYVGRFPSYACLTSHTAVHNTLLTVGKMHNDYIAASKIQSMVRMFLIRRYLRNVEINKKANRNTLLEDVVKSKGGNPKAISTTSRYFKHHETQYRKEINALTNMCKNPLTNEHNIKRILYIFFEICSNNKRYLSKEECTVLLCDILRLPITKNDAINYILSSKDFSNNGMIDYHQLCRWFLSYRQKHINDKISCFKKVFESWFMDPLPVNIILNYLDIRAMLYDACISLMVFDLKHSGYSLPKRC